MSRTLRASLVALWLAGCGAAPARSEPAAPPIATSARAWGGRAPPWGGARAVVERDGRVAVFGTRGVGVLVDGAIVASDDSVRGFRSAAEVPAADGDGRWILAVDGAGRVRRLRAPCSLEDVSDRYGLAADRVRAVAALDPQRVAFASDHGLAVVDGARITRYAVGALSNLAAGGGRVASVTPEGVLVFDPGAGGFARYPLAGAVRAVLDPDGRLVVVTPTAVYTAARGDAALALRYTGRGAVRGLAVEGARVWFALDGVLTALDPGTGVLARTSAAALARDAMLQPTRDGAALWSVARDGALEQLAAAPSARGANAWSRAIEPVFARACATCHAPGGSAGVDLSTEAAWRGLRDQVRQQVLASRAMPPAPRALPDDDRAAIARWLAAGAAR